MPTHNIYGVCIMYIKTFK